MELKTENGPEVAVMNWDQVSRVLAGLDSDNNSFAILERSDGSFVQTAVTEEGFVVERNEGSLDRHFVAKTGTSAQFRIADVQAIFRAFYDRSPFPVGITWERMTPQAIPGWVVKLLWALPFLGIAYLAYAVVRDGIRLWEWMK